VFPKRQSSIYYLVLLLVMQFTLKTEDDTRDSSTSSFRSFIGLSMTVAYWQRRSSAISVTNNPILDRESNIEMRPSKHNFKHHKNGKVVSVFVFQSIHLLINGFNTFKRYSIVVDSRSSGTNVANVKCWLRRP
jgi:hypothetical protein